MGAVWAFLRNPTNRLLLSWLGGGAVVIVGGVWAVVTYVWPAHEISNSGMCRSGYRDRRKCLRIIGQTLSNRE